MPDDSERLIDEILVLDCQSGRMEAMRALVTRWQKRFWQHALYLTGDQRNMIERNIRRLELRIVELVKLVEEGRKSA